MKIKQTICFGITTKIIREKLCLFPLTLLLTMVLLGGVFQFTAKAGSAEIPAVTSVDEPFPSFETHLEFIRQELKIPGMSAAIVKDHALVWATGFGYADLEHKVAATPDTPYGLASVTKPIGAVVIMQLVEEGLVDLDAPINQYGVDLGNDAITVRHLLTHTSEGIPGTEHHYNGNRYGYLGGVIEGASGQTFAALLSENILLPLGMKNTALNPFNSSGGTLHNILEDLKLGLGWGKNYQQYPDVYNRLALPYQFDEAYNTIPGMYQTYHNPAAGMLSSVTDLAKFDIALDQGLLLGNAAKNEMFSPAYSTYQNRQDLMYGLGWYVQDFDGLELIWHCGRWEPSTSALYLKVPEKNLTFIILANTDNLTVPFAGIGYGDVSKSALALAFFRYFIFPEQHSTILPNINWDADQEILIQQLANVEDESAQ